jgi:hypothetical protein
MVDADPARTPSFALFAKPDYFLSTGLATCPAAGCVTQNPGFAYDHGDYAAEINTNYVGFAGPGVKQRGLDGTGAADGPNSAGPNSGQTEVIDSGTTGTWTDETDIEPTELYLLGLHGDYNRDGRVITQILDDPNHALRGAGVTRLGACYKQLNSSVGQFGAYTLTASTNAVESNAPGDAVFNTVNARLLSLEKARDALAGQIKDELNDAAFSGVPVHDAQRQVFACQGIIDAAHQLARSS